MYRRVRENDLSNYRTSDNANRQYRNSVQRSPVPLAHHFEDGSDFFTVGEDDWTRPNKQPSITQRIIPVQHERRRIVPNLDRYEVIVDTTCLKLCMLNSFNFSNRTNRH